MIGQRSRYSLAQLLEQQVPAVPVTLISKHGGMISLEAGAEIYGLLDAIRSLTDGQLMAVVAEVVATTADLRHRINPKARFDARMHDLTQCLMLDGYQVEGGLLLQLDPTLSDAAPVDDDLLAALRVCSLPRAAAIVMKVEDSAQAFRQSEPDYNAALVNARVALETLAGDVASEVPPSLVHGAPALDLTKWGSIIGFLRAAGLISLEEERGLAGVYALLSVGAHRPVGIGISQAQMTRLGRSFALNMAWFLLQTHLQRVRAP